MRIATAAELREADRQAIEDLGLPGVCLMQSAGEALARACGPAKRIAFLCGKGNNGGDGFVAARHRKLAGDDVTVFLAAPASELRGDAAIHFAPLAALGIPLLPLESADFRPFELLVDCLLGTGAKGAPTGILAQAIAAANASGVPILACDLPSGVDADTGQVLGEAIRATQTLTLAALKPCLLLYPGVEHAGKVVVAPIGLPFTKESTQELTTADWVRRVVPKRTQGRDANKGAFGKLLVLAGSRGMVGAAVLTATAALRAGAGLVYLALPESLVSIVASMVPELVLKPLPETPEGTHGGLGALDALQVLLQTTSASAMAIGPGMTTHPAVQELIAGLIAYPYPPLVIDADGLAAIADHADLFLAEPKRDVVFTPHPGEMARLIGRRTYHVQAERPEAARLCAQKFGVVALLKGARTLIASPSGELYYNRDGSVALATAGSGDVLTGVIGALLAQGLSANEAARVGAYWHALAGECAEKEIGKIGVLATEIRDRLPVARRWLDEGGDLDK